MTKIQWADLTANPLKVLNNEEEKGNYCIKVSPGCAHCYSERLNATPRFGGNGLKYRVMPLDPSQLVFEDGVMEKLAKMKKGKRVFIASMTDIFAEFWPMEFQFKLLDYAAESPQHQFLLLTKRAEHMAKVVNIWLETHELVDVPIHIMLGVSAENQTYFDQRVPFLAKLPARRFVSLEPLLGSIDIAKYGDWLDWVIVGGESGPGARPMNGDWARQIRDDCHAFRVPFFFKQWGGVNKKLTGRLLDGVEYNQFPSEVTPC